MNYDKWEARIDLENKKRRWLTVLAFFEGVAAWLCVAFVLSVVTLFLLLLVFRPGSLETARLGASVTAFIVGAGFWPGSLIVRRHIHDIKRWFRK